VHTGFSWGSPRERDHLEDPGVDGRLVKSDGGMDWIELAENRDRWWALERW